MHIYSPLHNLVAILLTCISGFSVKAVQLPTAILNVKELGGQCFNNIVSIGNKTN